MTGEPTVERVPGTNTGHGHVWKRPDGKVYRCGGPRMCQQCGSDAATVAGQKAADEARKQALADDMLAHYMAALDEIYRVRAGLAWECAHLDKVLTRRSLPVSVRLALVTMRERLVQAARGVADHPWAALPSHDRREALRQAGASPSLTRGQWEGRDRG